MCKIKNYVLKRTQRKAIITTNEPTQSKQINKSFQSYYKILKCFIFWTMTHRIREVVISNMSWQKLMKKFNGNFFISCKLREFDVHSLNLISSRNRTLMKNVYVTMGIMKREIALDSNVTKVFLPITWGSSLPFLKSPS